MLSMKRTDRRFAGAAVVVALSVLALIACALPAAAQAINENTFKGMRWRLIGPFRGGRVLAVTGVEGDTKTYYFGAVAGGVWKTVNGGVTWTPVFDKQSIHHGCFAARRRDGVRRRGPPQERRLPPVHL